MMMAQAPDGNPHPVTVGYDVSPTIPAPLERHWFVPDHSGAYCQACNLPRANRRHAPKVA